MAGRAVGSARRVGRRAPAARLEVDVADGREGWVGPARQQLARLEPRRLVERRRPRARRHGEQAERRGRPQRRQPSAALSQRGGVALSLAHDAEDLSRPITDTRHRAKKLVLRARPQVVLRLEQPRALRVRASFRVGRELARVRSPAQATTYHDEAHRSARHQRRARDCHRRRLTRRELRVGRR